MANILLSDNSLPHSNFFQFAYKSDVPSTHVVIPHFRY